MLAALIPFGNLVAEGDYEPLRRLCPRPQCGFSSTSDGNLITEADQWAKLERLVGVTRQVWGAA